MTNKKWDKDAVMKLMQKKKESESSSYNDARFWAPVAPKKGKHVYRVRILPNMKAGGEAWVKVLKHGFQAPNGTWFIENCPATLGGKCPVDEYASPLFKSGDTKDEQFARKIYRKKNYIANILVIKDPRDNGANEGKVFLWRFGQKIYEKLDSAMFPPADSGMDQLMFIDPYEGFDLQVVSKLVHDGNNDYPNYDESVFVRDKTPIAKDEAGVDKILEACYDLEGEFLSPSQFKSYEDLKKQFDSQVVNYRKNGVSEPPSSKKNEPSTKKESVEEDTEEQTPVVPASKKATVTKKKEAEPTTDSDEDFIKSLEAELNTEIIR